jgi:hypothetical protein
MAGDREGVEGEPVEVEEVTLAEDYTCGILKAS